MAAEITSPMDAYDLTGRAAVVTGAASGIGAATSQLLARAGATVVCADVNLDGAEETLDGIKRAGGEGLVLRADVTARADVEALVATAVGECGRLDAMCNVAGAMFPGRIEDLDDAVIEAGLALNLKSVIYGTQYAIRAMKPGRTGSIVNVSSAAIDCLEVRHRQHLPGQRRPGDALVTGRPRDRRRPCRHPHRCRTGPPGRP
jgi:3-oxoacyl-[acyl-carrier protein] reductase